MVKFIVWSSALCRSLYKYSNKIYFVFLVVFANFGSLHELLTYLNEHGKRKRIKMALGHDLAQGLTLLAQTKDTVGLAGSRTRRGRRACRAQSPHSPSVQRCGRQWLVGGRGGKRWTARARANHNSCSGQGGGVDMHRNGGSTSRGRKRVGAAVTNDRCGSLQLGRMEERVRCRLIGEETRGGWGSPRKAAVMVSR
jgi:hypothetical protein